MRAQMDAYTEMTALSSSTLLSGEPEASNDCFEADSCCSSTGSSRTRSCSCSRTPQTVREHFHTVDNQAHDVEEMTTETKLAVILHADVVGSTALVQADERLAHDRIVHAFRNVSAVIAKFGGTTHEIRGDALVAEFGRPSDTVCAALIFQAANEEANPTLTGDVISSLRVGIALGEVVIADATVTGAGVILAQRLEQESPAGGVVVPGQEVFAASGAGKRIRFGWHDRRCPRR